MLSVCTQSAEQDVQILDTQQQRSFAECLNQPLLKLALDAGILQVIVKCLPHIGDNEKLFLTTQEALYKILCKAVRCSSVFYVGFLMLT